MLALKAKKVFTGLEVIEDGVVIVEDEKAVK